MASDAVVSYPSINPERIPKHVAIIMDGNGRWAKQQGHMRIFGHKQGVNAVRNTLEFAAEIGIEYRYIFVSFRRHAETQCRCILSRSYPSDALGKTPLD